MVPVGAGLFDGRVYAAEMTGEQTLVTIEKGGATLVIKMPKDCDVAYGSPVGVRFPPGRGFVFDASSGQRLSASLVGA